jgi:hypothetical protein
MARMIRLTPPPAQDIGDGWQFVVASAGTYSDATRVDLQLYNGELRDADKFSLTLRKEREEFAGKVEELSGLPRGDISRALLLLKDKVEIALRKHDEVEKKAKDEDEESTSIFDDPEPWDDPVDGASLITTLQGIIERHVALPTGASYAVALWICHTYLLDALWTSPILLITSPRPRCGKTTLLSVIQAMSRRAFTAASITPAALYRAIPKWQPTILIDEADTFLRENNELRGVINSGHTKDTAQVIRCDGDSYEPELFSTWAAKAIASIGQQKDTITDRSIEIPMRRRLPGETVERWRGDRLGQFKNIKRQCLRWAIDNADAVRDTDPDVPDWLNDRAADNWRSLLQIADVAGGKSHENAIQALDNLVGEGHEEDESTGIMLLRDMQLCFEKSKHGRITSDNFTEFLHAIEDRPWAEWGRSGKHITKRQVAQLLKPFGIRPKQVRVDSVTAKGYCLEDCQDSFFRYLPPSRNETPKQPSNGAGLRDFSNETQGTNVSDEKPIIPSNGADCFGVSFRKGGADEKKVISDCFGSKIDSEDDTEMEETNLFGDRDRGEV